MPMDPFELQALSLLRVRELYAERMVRDFPRNELKPLPMIERALARGEYACYGAVRDGEVLAYAFFVLQRDGAVRCALFDYYAVREDLRDHGVGSAFIRALIRGPLADLDCVLLEVDDPAYAPDARELEIRNRRLEFYLRNGLSDTAVTAEVFRAPFRILSLPVGERLTPRQAGRYYALLYRCMLPAPVYKRAVKIYVPAKA